jgi:hypothetical protein
MTSVLLIFFSTTVRSNSGVANVQVFPSCSDNIHLCEEYHLLGYDAM